MKKILLFIFFSSAIFANEIPKNQIYLTSLHSIERGGGENWNNRNIGYAYHFENGLKIGGYYNSEYKTTLFVGYEQEIFENFGYILAVGTGYEIPVGGAIYYRIGNFRTDVFPLIVENRDGSNRRVGIGAGFSLTF